MNNDYWLKRWVDNRIGFHRTGVNPLLEQFLPRVAAAPGRTLLPLCGKSEDLAWLLSRGHDVVGVDVAEMAARAFGSEQRMPLTVADQPPFTIFRAERFAYYVGDFFNFNPEMAGRFNLIYDRAALIALSPGQRVAYARQLNSLLAPGGQILLISLEYDQRRMEGPPFCVPAAEVVSLFAGRNVEKLHKHDSLEEDAHFKERGLDWMKEVVYAIR